MKKTANKRKEVAMETALAYLGGFAVLFLVAFGMHWLMRGDRHKYSPDNARNNLDAIKKSESEGK